MTSAAYQAEYVRRNPERWRRIHDKAQYAYRRTPKGAYTAQKYGAKKRGIAWEFTFETWWEMWKDLWPRRGQQSDSLCMARRGDKGPYSPSNVRIVTIRENVLEAKGMKHD